MEQAEDLSRLVGEIYDAALDPSAWHDVLGKVAHFVGGQGAALLAGDMVSKANHVFYTNGIRPDFLQLYVERYAALDPTMINFFFFDVGEVISTTDFIAYDEFLETRFYKEWAEPQGWVDAAQAILEKSLTSYAYICFLRDRASGCVDEDMHRRTRLVVPHLRRAVLIGRVIDFKEAKAATLSDALDGLKAAMFLVDADRRILHANASGHALLGRASLLRDVGGRLTASNAANQQALQDLFSNAEAAAGVKGIAVPLMSRDNERYVAHALPLTSGQRRQAGVSHAAVAALFFRKAALDPPAPPTVIAQTYGLTPSELRVLLSIVDLGGVVETAAALGIGESTVRTHLHRLFTKTGSTRQADLAKLVASYANPLAR
jgi:DNA-binding CsgD family transcriptional regulator/PAS domain-containing protein